MAAVQQQHQPTAPGLPVRDVYFGRLRVPTLYDDLQEALGDELNVTGAVALGNERRPRTFTFNLPLHGSEADGDPYAAGLRMRRQVRALMQNAAARLAAPYFAFTQDTELNGWLVVGVGNVVYKDGGITLANFELQLQNAYLLGTQRTHRPARRAVLYDRRLSTTPRDYLGTVYGTDYSALTPLALSYLPVGATDVTGVGKRVVATLPLPSAAGSVPLVVAANDGEVLSYEQPEVAMGLADDVVAYDRRGVVATSDNHANAALLDRPVLYARLGEAPGTTVAADSSETANHGTYVNTPTLGLTGYTADTDTAAGFSDVALSYALFADVAELDITGDLSIEYYVAPKDTSAGIEGVTKYKSAAGARSYRFGVNRATGDLVFEISSNGTTSTQKTFAAGLLPAHPYLIGAEYHAALGTVDFYVNGTLVGSASGLPTSIFAGSANLNIGAWEAT